MAAEAQDSTFDPTPTGTMIDCHSPVRRARHVARRCSALAALIVAAALLAPPGLLAAQELTAATTPAPLPPTPDPQALRAAFLAALDAARREHRQGPLRASPSCERAAQRHAEDLLPVLRAGEPPTTVTSLALLIQEERRTGSGTISGGATRMQRGSIDRASSITRSVGQAVVVDALSGEEAVATALAAGPSDLTAPGFVAIGVGVAIDLAGPPPRAVWVACLTRG